jgi:hypothetical protein
MELIPTSSKEKLSKGMSYPVGSEIISKALFGAQQFNQFVLYYYRQDEYWASIYNKKVSEKGVITILEAGSNRPAEGFRINVNSIPSEHKSAAKEYIQEKALPRLAKKLGALSEDGYLYFKCNYDLNNNSLSIEI